jgi:DMSO/TMAO reductase YedYZ heme-binding membrane subunit
VSTTNDKYDQQLELPDSYRSDQTWMLTHLVIGLVNLTGAINLLWLSLRAGLDLRGTLGVFCFIWFAFFVHSTVMVLRYRRKLQIARNQASEEAGK